jgi:hypothetical protein
MKKTPLVNHFYSTRKDENYLNVLTVDGKDTICPFRTTVPVPQQTSLGQMTMQLVQFPCCTLCPMAEFIDDWDDQQKAFIQLFLVKCSGRNVEIEITENETEQNTLKLI